jgi:Spy/CpxP family protein refolding chaperone
MTAAASWKVFLYAAIIFVAGLFVGAISSPFLARTFLRPPPPGEMSHHLLTRLRSDLALTPEQTAQIKPLVVQAAADLDAIRVRTTKQVSDRIAETNAKIAVFLTPEQKAKLEKMQERRKHMSGEPPFLPPPPR